MNMTDPNTPTTSSNPQDLIDQALGGTTTTPTPPEPTLPIPEPLSPPTTTEPAIEQKPEDVVATPTIETVPVELTSAQTKPMGEDMPLSFATTEPENNQNVEMPVSPMPKVEPVDTVVPPATLGAASFQPSPKKKSNKIMVAIIGFFAFLGVMGAMGYYAYERYGTIEPATIAAVQGKNTPESCQGCSREVDGGWLVWRNGECKVTGICNSSAGNKDPVTGDSDKDTAPPPPPAGVPPADNCQKIGGFWCEVTDANGKNHSFCGSNSKACYQSAIDKGITMSIGKVECDCKEYSGEGVNKTCVKWGGTDAIIKLIDDNKTTSDDTKNLNKSLIETQCNTHGGSFTGAGDKEMWICPKGTTVACTNLNGKRFYGNPTGCFCGVIQIDTGSGHTSYSSTCGCDEPSPNPSIAVSPSPSPSVTTATLMCSSLTRTPNTTPAIGDKLTFTCAGASTPAGAVNLTYKFRYSINNGSYTSLTNKTATTAELTIATCGGYKVQCQACGTINGVLTCDPNWTAATQ